MAQFDILKLHVFSVLILKDGSSVSGEAVCDSPESFNEKEAQYIARKFAEIKIDPGDEFSLPDTRVKNPYVGTTKDIK